VIIEETGMREKRDQTRTDWALLVQFDGDTIVNQWPLDRDVTHIGRWPDNDIVVHDRWTSRYHTEIRREGAHYHLYDLSSKNGTLVNGQHKRSRHHLVDGDQISVAPLHIFTFVDYAATAPLPGKRQPALRLHAETRGLYVQGQVLNPPLSQIQYDFLAALLRDAGRVYGRDELIRAVWPEEDPSGISNDAINALVHRLRSRLREIEPEHEFVVTARGYGFRLDLPEDG
jgi:hypothetical protein